MKQLPVLLLLAMLFSPVFSFSQKDNMQMDAAQAIAGSQVYETMESMSQGLKNAIVVEVASSDDRMIEKLWKDYMKDYGGKMKRSKGGKDEFLTSGVEIVTINGVNDIDIYSRTVSEKDGTSTHMVWFDLGEEYLDSDRKEQYREAEELLKKFAHQVKTEQTQSELKDAEKELKSIEGNLKQLERQNEGYHKDIENYEKKIEEAKENIATNIEQQEDTRKKIELQLMLVEEIDRRLREMKKQ